MTKGPVEMAWTDTPRETGSETLRPTPAGSVSENTCTVARPPAGTVTPLVTPEVPSKAYLRATVTGTDPGLPRVRNSYQFGMTLPSARFHSLAGRLPKLA